MEADALDDSEQIRGNSLITALAKSQGLTTTELLLFVPFFALYSVHSALLALLGALLRPLVSCFRGAHTLTAHQSSHQAIDRVLLQALEIFEPFVARDALIFPKLALSYHPNPRSDSAPQAQDALCVSG